MRKISSFHGNILILFIILLYGAIFFLFRSSVPLFCADTSCYIGLSESIAEQKNYHFNDAPHTKYPPTYPLFLSVIRIIAKSSQHSLFITATAFLGLIGVLLSFHLLKKISLATAFIMTLLLLTSPAFFYISTGTILSDLPYFTFYMLSLLLGLKLCNATSPIKKYFYIVLLSIALIISVLTRSIGMMLSAGYILWLLYLFIINRTKAFHTIKLFIIPLTAGFISTIIWLLWSKNNSIIQYTGQYMDSYFAQIRLIDPHRPELGSAAIGDFIVRIINNMSINVAHLNELATHIWLSPSLLSVFILPIIILISIGIGYKIISGKADFLLWYFCSYMMMMFLWPFNEGERFILPVFPLAGLYFFEGSVKIFELYRKKSVLFYKLVLFFSIPLSLISLYLLSTNKLKGMQESISSFLWLFCPLLILVIPFYKKFLRHNYSIAKIIRKITDTIFSPGFLKPVGFILIAVLCIIGLTSQINIANNNLKIRPNDSHNYPLVQAGEWLRKNVSPQSIICATQKEIIFQTSGIKTVPFPVSSSVDLLINTIKKLNAEYLIVYDEGNFPYFFPTDNERFSILNNVDSDLLSSIYNRQYLQIFKINRNRLNPI